MIPCIYEMALKQNPKNEELYSHLFMAYVRIGDYKKQQQVNLVHSDFKIYFCLNEPNGFQGFL